MPFDFYNSPVRSIIIGLISQNGKTEFLPNPAWKQVAFCAVFKKRKSIKWVRSWSILRWQLCRASLWIEYLFVSWCNHHQQDWQIWVLLETWTQDGNRGVLAFLLFALLTPNPVFSYSISARQTIKFSGKVDILLGSKISIWPSCRHCSHCLECSLGLGERKALLSFLQRERSGGEWPLLINRRQLLTSFQSHVN